MRHKILPFVVMTGVAIILATALDIGLTATPGWPLLVCSWVIVVTINLIAAWSTPTSRLAWMKLSIATGAIGAIVAAAVFVMPVLAASFEPGVDWHSLDLTPPIAARLREALMSGYFALAMIAVVAVLFGIAYLLSHKDPEHQSHAH